MNTLITANILYRETYLPPRCRKFKEVYLTSTVTFPIQTTTHQEAPVALQVDTEDFRYFNGKLWKRHGESEYNPKLQAQVFTPYTVESYRATQLVVADYMRHQYREAFIAAQPKGTVVSDQGLAGKAMEKTASLTKILFIGNEVWAKSDEPYYSNGRLRWADPDINTQKFYHCDTRADQPPYPDLAVVKVLIPSALRLDPYGSALKRARVELDNQINQLLHYNPFSPWPDEVFKQETRDAFVRVLTEK